MLEVPDPFICIPTAPIRDVMRSFVAVAQAYDGKQSSNSAILPLITLTLWYMGKVKAVSASEHTRIGELRPDPSLCILTARVSPTASLDNGDCRLSPHPFQHT